MGDNDICGRCKFGKAPRLPDGTVVWDVRECHYGPPHVQYFLMPLPPAHTPDGQIVQRPPQIIEHSGWPKVPSRESCGQFEAAGLEKAPDEPPVVPMTLDLNLGGVG